MVLHFDYEHRWTGPRSLKECFKKITPKLKPYVSDYKINVFEIAWLPDDTIANFKSDFRFVADYYSQMRKTGKWQPMPGIVKHIKELFDLFSVVTNDTQFIQMYQKSKGDVKDMSCVALDYLMEKYKPIWDAKFAEEYKPQWEKEYKPQWEMQAKLDSIRSLMKSLNFSVSQAMDALFIPQEDRQRYMDKL